MSASAVVELRVALAQLLKADPTLDNLLSGSKVYALKAPSRSSLNYVVIGPTLIDRADNYHNGNEGRRHRRRLSMWARSPDTTELIYQRLVTLLDGQLFALSGHWMQQSSFSMIAGPIEDEVPMAGTDKPEKAWGIHAEWLLKTVEMV